MGSWTVGKGNRNPLHTVNNSNGGTLSVPRLRFSLRGLFKSARHAKSPEFSRLLTWYSLLPGLRQSHPGLGVASFIPTAPNSIGGIYSKQGPQTPFSETQITRP